MMEGSQFAAPDTSISMGTLSVSGIVEALTPVYTTAW